jgi:uncharacterized Zn-finger protein
VSGQPKEVQCPECGNRYTLDWNDKA